MGVIFAVEFELVGEVAELKSCIFTVIDEIRNSIWALPQIQLRAFDSTSDNGTVLLLQGEESSNTSR